jgi:uncharacterized Zn finger protein (UPF0148 family)
LCKKCGEQQLHKKGAWYCVECNAAKANKTQPTRGKGKAKAKQQDFSESDESESDFEEDDDDDEQEYVYVVEKEEDTDVRLARMEPMTPIEIAFPTKWGPHWVSGMVLVVNPDKTVTFCDGNDGDELTEVDLHDYTWKFL